jgi:hypothetical protein
MPVLMDIDHTIIHRPALLTVDPTVSSLASYYKHSTKKRG